MSQEIVNIVGSVGFPIVAYFFMYLMVTSQLKENTAMLQMCRDALNHLIAYLEAKEGADIDGA